jgi:hypothetical protein
MQKVLATMMRKMDLNFDMQVVLALIFREHKIEIFAKVQQISAFHP